MREIETIHELKREQDRLMKFISYSELFPVFNLRVKPKAFWFFDFHYAFELAFFSILAEYCKAIGNDGFSYITIDPDPVNTYRYFGYLASAKFTFDDAPQSLENFVLKAHEVKENEKREGYATTENIFTTLSAYGMVSSSDSWIIYGEYGLDISVLATFVDSEAKNLLSSHPNFLSIEDVVDWIKVLGPGGCTIDPEAFRRSWQEQKLLP